MSAQRFVIDLYHLSQWDKNSPGPPPPPPPRAIFIRGFSHLMPTTQIRQQFSAFGRIDDLQVEYDQSTGQSLGMCWIRYEGDDQENGVGQVAAQNAIKKFNRQRLGWGQVWTEIKVDMDGQRKKCNSAVAGEIERRKKERQKGKEPSQTQPSYPSSSSQPSSTPVSGPTPSASSSTKPIHPSSLSRSIIPSSKPTDERPPIPQQTRTVQPLPPTVPAHAPTPAPPPPLHPSLPPRPSSTSESTKQRHPGSRPDPSPEHRAYRSSWDRPSRDRPSWDRPSWDRPPRDRPYWDDRRHYRPSTPSDRTPSRSSIRSPSRSRSRSRSRSHSPTRAYHRQHNHGVPSYVRRDASANFCGDSWTPRAEAELHDEITRLLQENGREHIHIARSSLPRSACITEADVRDHFESFTIHPDKVRRHYLLDP